MKKNTAKLALLIIPLLVVFPQKADTTWSQSNLQFLTSHKYLDVSDSSDFSGHTLTFEHAANYNWGKSFLFIDRFQGAGGNNNDETYMEIGVDISLSHMLGKSVSAGMVKDVYWVMQWEQSNTDNELGNNLENYLYGIGLSWDIPSFSYFNTHFYQRNNSFKSSNTQFSTSWSYPFNINQYQFYFDGFIDIESHPKDSVYLIKAQPQLKFDVGQLFHTSNTYLVGIEIEVLRNKFGKQGKDQLAPQLLLQVTF